MRCGKAASRGKAQEVLAVFAAAPQAVPTADVVAKPQRRPSMMSYWQEVEPANDDWPLVAPAQPTAVHKAAGGIVSFFSGCGMLDLGFEMSGYRTHLACEVYRPFAAAYTYALRQMGLQMPVHGVAQTSIDEFLEGSARADELRAIMAQARAQNGTVGFIGGPPCPDFSIAGKQAGQHGAHGRLSQSYVDLICEQQPDWFLFENVKGLVSTAAHRAYFDRLKAQLRATGYHLTERLANAVEYGTPQFRERIFLVGFREDSFQQASILTEDFPWNRHAVWPGRAALDLAWPGAEEFGVVNRPWPADLPPAARELTVQHWFESNDVDHHSDARGLAPKSARLATVAEGDDGGKSFKRLHRHRPSSTACYGKNEVHLHPWLPRRLGAGW